MTITILALGTRGDVQPFVALGRGLQKAGYTVNIATHKIFETFIRQAGLGFRLVRSNPKAMVTSNIGQSMTKNWGTRFRSSWQLARLLKPELFRAGEDCWNACQETDAIICSHLSFPFGTAIAEKLQIPSILLRLFPTSQTRVFPFLAIQRDLGPTLNRLTYPMVKSLIWSLFLPGINQWRQQLGLPSLGLNYYLYQWLKEQHPVIYGFSSYVVPKPPDWGEHIKVSGYWFLDRSEDWQPPIDLVAFLESGTPPVFIGFGSMHTHNPEKMAELVLGALILSNQRGVLVTAWGGLDQRDLPASIFKINSIPYDWLFPHMAALIHHAGAGTTGISLQAGIPTVTIPLLFSQPFWGKRLAELGVGPPPISRKKLSVEHLADAITTAVTDTEMRQRAAKLGERIRTEDGVARAVEFINTILA